MAFENSEVKIINHEKVKIPLETHIEEAEKYRDLGDFKMAEKKYFLAFANARGTSEAKRAIQIVKEGLSKVYLSWYQKCCEDNDFPDAEKALKNYAKVSGDKSYVKELKNLYSSWAWALEAFDKNTIGFVIAYKKMICVILENGGNVKEYLELLFYRLYKTENRNFWNVADQLRLSVKGNKLKLLLKIVILLIIAFLSPILAPTSIIIFLFSLAYAAVEASVERGPKRAAILVIIGALMTIVSLGFLVFVYFDMTVKGERILFYVIAAFSVMTLFAAIKQIRLLLSYKRKKVSKILDELFPQVKLKCPNCGKKHTISGDTVEEVKCSDCDAVIWEGIDLEIKNKPDKKKGGKSMGVNLEYALSRATIFSFRMLMRHFFGI